MATGVAKEMKTIFCDQVDVEVLLNDSALAQQYTLKGSTNVFVNEELVPLDVATSKENMEGYLKSMID